jgi:diguanylate cyclase (GGDEF)-like protein/PAS domain S-box-containing protein
MPSARLMVVEDEVLVAKDISFRLQRMGYLVVGSTGRGGAAIDLAMEWRPDLILMDINLRDDIDGIEAAALIKQGFDVPIIFCTAFSNAETLERAKITAPYGYILKPFENRELEINIEIALYKHRTERKLRETEARLNTTLRNVSDAVIATDNQGKVRVINSVAESLILLDPARAQGMSIGQLLELKDFDRRDHSLDLESAVLERGQNLRGIRQHLVRRNGSEVPVEISANVIRGESVEGDRIGMVVSLRDISQQIDYESQIRRNAFYDLLTDLPNRFLFLDRVRHAIFRAKQADNNRFAVLFIDLDRFRGINEGLGHQAGDQLIVEVSRRIELVIDKADTLSRFGGDIFAVLLENNQRLQEVIVTCENIQNAFEASFEISDMSIDISCSVGIVLSHELYNSAEDILRDADTAMHRAKSEKKGGHTVFDHEMHANALRYIEWGGAMKQALEEGKFEMYYQPIIAPGTGKIASMEALIRWRSSSYGEVSPAEFIPVAEETGLILPMGDWILETVCRQIRDWQDQYDIDLKVEVNLSGLQFGQADLSSKIERVLEETGIPASLLGVEITEGVAMRDIELSISTLEKLRGLGLSISIDDFGTGYSSLTCLKRYPINTLKIDRSFVMNITSNTDDQAIANAIIALAKALNLNVLAEGVETAEQLEYLVDSGCDYIQGYYYSRAMPATDVIPYLRREQLLERPKLRAPGPIRAFPARI